MRAATNVFLSPDDEIRILRNIDSTAYPHEIQVRPVLGLGTELKLFATRESLLMIYLLLGNYLSLATPRPVSAEACTGAVVDSDDVLESILEGLKAEPYAGEAVDRRSL